MVKNRTFVAYLFSVVLTIIEFFPGVQCYHFDFCVGRIIGGYGISSIGSQNQAFHDHRLAMSLYGVPGCGIIEPNTQWTAYYIVYNSNDISLDKDEDNALLGWIHINLTLASPINIMIIQPKAATLPLYGTPGQFESTRFRPGLKETIDDWNMPKAHLSPCWYAINPSPFYAVAFTLQNNSAVSSMKFNFRMDFPECATLHEKNGLEFRFFGNSESNKVHCMNIIGVGDITKLYSADMNYLFVKNSTYGSSDPEPPRNAPIEVKPLGPNIPNNLWVTDYSRSILVNQNNPDRLTDVYRYKSAFPNRQRFMGRCSRLPNWSYHCGHTAKLRCEGENSHRVGPGYTTYYTAFSAGAGTQGTGETCTGCVAARNNTRTKGLSANSEIGEIIWGFRTTHGISMVMTTMFVVPLGTLVSRYYKETLMGMRFVNVHVWHGIHISTALTAFAGLFSGWLAAFTGRSFFGFSRHSVGYLHWILGYISFLFFFLALFPSPIRAFAKGMRKITIFLHFLVATVARVLWLLCLLTSFYIPGSPSGRNDIHVSGFTVEFNAFIVVVWFIVDVVLNVILMVFLKGTDKEKKKSRTYALTVPIPLIRPYAQEDLPGAPMRKILLAVHTSVCFVCALVLTTQICWSSPRGRWFGPLWYTHKDSGKLNMLMKDTFYD